MKPYHQITALERYALMLLQKQGLRPAAIARALGRHRSSITRELHRNSANADGYYRPQLADWYATGRRSASRRNTQFTPRAWRFVRFLLKEDWSPDQIAGWLRRFKILSISHETIYRHVWDDKANGGDLHTHLRCAPKRFRKRYGQRDSRGRLAGKRLIGDRPAAANRRSEIGHWEADTVLGDSQAGPCILTMVERKTGYLAIGKLQRRTAPFCNARARHLINAQLHPVRTITVDNGTEFHSYQALETKVDARFYFATPHHSWERGTNENTNGLIRQYLPKRHSMAHLSQHDCNRIATQLNRRPRKRLGYRTPEECYVR
jgi:IS30 family transposase